MILKIEPSKGGKLSILADDEYVMTVDPDTWYSLDYSNGCEVSDEEFEHLKFILISRKAYAQALRFLTLRAHSADELYKKLIKKHSPESSQYAVEKCRELGFIDDEDFAIRYSQELIQKKKYGLSRVKTELFGKGIDREIIDKVLSELETDSSSAIIEIVEKKYSSCFENEKDKRRMISGLMRLGYSYGEIRSALSEYISDEEYHNEY
ncbi:MAG: regulatory protein RecX [Clostridia bacterium]|nr:regulatory protein RecX [Clostridia bacterium]